MDFRVLGPLEVESEGTLLELGPRKQRMLLLSLLLEPGMVRSTDQLIDDIWGDDPPGNPATSLRAYLSNLRKILEPNRADGSRPSILLRRANGYVLAIDPGQVDTGLFAEEVAAARQLTGENRLQVVERALARWRGDPFAELDDNDTARVVSGGLHELRREAVVLQSTGLLDMGRAREAISVLQLAATSDPYDETLQAQLALALYHAGRQTEALRSIDKARSILADELGLDPGPVLRDVESRILNHEVEPLRPSGGPPETTPVVAPAVDVAVAEPAQTRAVQRRSIAGRHHEFDTLMEAMRRVGDTGAGEVVLVSGPAGIGKTRLVEELTGRCASTGGTVVWAHCEQSTADIGLWPWSAALRDVIEGRDEAARDHLIGPDRKALAGVVPSLADELAAGGGQFEPDDLGRHHAFDAATRFLRRLGQIQPVLIVVEDAHWADSASLELLGFLSKRLRDLRVLVVVTTRDEGLNHPRILDVRATATSLSLAPLGEAELRDLIAEEAPHLAASIDDAVEMLLARSAGNPLIATHLLREIDPADPAVALGQTAQASVADIVARQLADLPPGTEELLTVASTAQAQWGLDIACAVTGISLDQAIDCVEAAITAGLVEEEPDRVGDYRFSHALVGDAIDGRLSAIRRASLYAKVGAEIEARRNTDEFEVVADLARHYCIGAAAGTALAGGRWAVVAGRQAISRFDPESAIRRADQGLAALEHAPRTAERALVEVDLLVLRSEAVRRLHDIVGSHRDVLAAWEVAREAGDIDAMARCAIVYAGNSAVGTWLGYWVDLERSAAITEEVLRLGGEDLDLKTRVMLLNSLADARHDGFVLGQGERITAEALELARKTDDTALLIDSLAMRQQSALFSLTPAEQLALGSEMVDLGKGSGAGLQELYGRRIVLKALFDLQEFEAVETELAEIEGMRDRCEDETAAFVATWVPLGVQILRGDLVGAEAGIFATIEQFSHFEEARLDVLSLMLAPILRERHQLDSVEPMLRQRLADQDTHSWRAPLLLIMTEHDRMAEARELLDSMPDTDFTTVTESVLHLMSPCLLAEAVAHMGDESKARLLLDLLTPYADQLVNFNLGMQYHGWVGYYVGRLLRVVGDFAGAERHLTDARQRADAAGAAIYVMRADVALAEVAAAQGSPVDLGALIADARFKGYESVAVWAERVAKG